jgi:molybdate transport system ATP-binding protein
VEVLGVRVEMSGAVALEGLHWRLLPGQNWVVAGPNGSGKSTFLKLLSGDIHPTSGSVRRFGLAGPPNLWELRARMGLVSWELQASHPPDTTVRDVLVSGFHGSFGLYDQPLPGMLAMAAGWMERLELDGLADRAMDTLSQGQARRVLIGRALAFDPQVLLLDEPLGGLDAWARAQTLALLDDLCAQGRQIVMVTHNPGELPASITHALLLDKGRAAAQGPIDAVRTVHGRG